MASCANLHEILNLQQRERAEHSHIEFANKFVGRYRGKFLFDHNVGAWFHWTGWHWEREETQLAFDLIRKLITEETDGTSTYTKEQIRKASNISSVERIVKGDREIAIKADGWNKHQMLLATPGGTVDLRTGRLRPGNPFEHINRITATAPAKTADCDRWLTFLDEATGKDDELIAFLQRWCGYCLTGDTSEHALVFVYGPGGSGKSVFLSTVASIVGDYATNAAMETFIITRHEGHPTDLAMLAGARLVTASETEEGRAWAEAKIKQLTGGDRITARFMRRDFFQYIPHFKLTIVGNHEPTLRNVDQAMKRRFNIVPFMCIPEKVDKKLAEKLKKEWPGILRWMIEGCLEWQKTGLKPSQAVQTATKRYFDRQDLFNQWLEDRCEVEQPRNRWHTATSVELFASWVKYAKAAGDEPGSRKAFASKLEREGFIAFRENGLDRTRAWRGVRLKPVGGKHPNDPDND